MKVTLGLSRYGLVGRVINFDEHTLYQYNNSNIRIQISLGFADHADCLYLFYKITVPTKDPIKSELSDYLSNGNFGIILNMSQEHKNMPSEVVHHFFEDLSEFFGISTVEFLESFKKDGNKSDTGSYCITKDYSHKGISLKGKSCKLLTTIVGIDTQKYYYVDFDEDVKGSSNDGKKKINSCLMLPANIISKKEQSE